MIRSIKIAIITMVALSALSPKVKACEYSFALAASNDTATTDTISDASITSAIEREYIADPELRNLDILVVTENGIVELYGQVPDQIIKQKAINLASNIGGVHEVISDIKIVEANVISNTVTDSAITAAIKSKFLRDTRINVLSIRVNTKKGIVTLKGKVPNDEMKEIAIAIAKNTNGVKKVISKLNVLNPRPDSYFSED